MIEITVTHPLPILELDEQAESLADKYVKASAVTENNRIDAEHIAIAVVNQLEALVSWNMDHIVRLSTKEIVDKVNQKFGYKNICALDIIQCSCPIYRAL